MGLVRLLLVLGLAWAIARDAGAKEIHNPLERINAAATLTRLDPGISITVNNTVLRHSGEWFEVSWRGVSHPGFEDWIGLLVPAGADPAVTSPAKYKIAVQSPTHLLFGKGSLRFRLINYRQDMQFVFMRGGLMSPVLAARSPVIRVAAPNQPHQVHLALTGDNTEMLVQWVTSNSSRPVVQWGGAPGQYTTTTPAATTATYTRDQMCGPPANTVGWVDPGVTHTARLTGLTPGARYYYRVGEEEGLLSREFSFRAAPPVGPTTSVQLLAVADLGQGEVDGSMVESQMPPSLNTTRLMEGEGGEVGLLLHNGDISYGRGYVTQWDNFMHQMEPLVARTPYMTAPGNHERDWPGTGDRYPETYDSGGECGVAYEQRLAMPLKKPGDQWYSFNYGPIHFLQYSTEQPFAPGSRQYSFIKSDLAAVDRAVTPWVVVGGHRPMYVSSIYWWGPDSDQQVAFELQQALEPLFVAYKVDMTWHGHHHSYQRSCPLSEYLCRGSDAARVPSAPIHLVIGHGGASINAPYPVTPAIWEVVKLWWGYLRVSANGTHLGCEVVSDLDGGLMDALTLTKPPGWGEDWMQQQHPLAPARVVQAQQRQQARSYAEYRRQQQQQQQQQQRRRRRQQQQQWQAGQQGWQWQAGGAAARQGEAVAASK